MSHYSAPNPNAPVPKARVAFFGASLVAVGLLGFYAYLHNKHERKHALDRADEGRARVSSWEHRMLQRGAPTPPSSSDFGSSSVLRAARVKARSTPLPPPTSVHNARHRTKAEDAASGVFGATRSSTSPSYDSSDSTESESNAPGINGHSKLSDLSARPQALDQPTAQKGHSDGRAGVYTKNPGWHEAAHYALGPANENGNEKKVSATGKREGDGVEEGEGEVQKVKEGLESVKEGVKGWFGK